MTPSVTAVELHELRQQHYNAVVAEVVDIHSDLRILRVKPDAGGAKFLPGQYTVLGLGYWERRVTGTDPEPLTDALIRKVAKRAYSFSCPMLDAQGHLVPPSYGEFIEFYIALVRHADDHPPSLTPRLFALNAGDRLFMGQKVTGHYTLEHVRPNDNIVFVATGTGEAPHNTMVAELLSIAHRGRLVAMACVRHKRDLAYLATYRELERRYPQLRYITLTTREPENLDPAAPGYVGKRYLQDYFASGDFERDTGLLLDPQTTHVFLCGNPAMIGAPKPHSTGPDRYPQPLGMVQVLEAKGLLSDEPGRPGSIRFEKYW